MTGSLRRTLGVAWANPSGKAGLVGMLALVLFAAIAPRWLPDPTAMPDLGAGALAPSAAHPFGTDQLSRDVLARVAIGGRVSLTIGFLAGLVSVTVGALVGLVAGHRGGLVDQLLMRTVDAALAIPRLFVLLLLLIVWERIPLPALILVLGLSGWFGTSRLVRGEVLRVKTQGFIHAAAALGAGSARTIFRHLLPNALGVVLVSATLTVGEVILLEAGLSYLGVGVPPPTPSWGGMVLDARDLMTTAPWTLAFPGFAILMTVLAMNLLSDALRAAFDPRGA